MKVATNFPKLLAQKEMGENKRYTQKEVAEGMGVSETTVSRLMNNKDVDVLRIKTVLRVCNWLGCSIEELGIVLLEDDGQPVPD